MNIFSWTTIIVCLFYFVVGVLLSRYVKKLDDYYVAGRAMPAIAVGGSFMAAWTSMVGLVGGAGAGWAWGLGTWLLFYGSFWGIVMFSMVFALPMRRGEFLTVPDYFTALFESKRIRAVCALVVVFSMGGYFIAQIVGAGVIIEGLTGMPYAYGMWLFTLTMAAYVVFGGMMAVVITDTLMFFAFLLCALAMPYMLDHFGGWEFLMVKLPEIRPGIWKLAGFQQGSAGPFTASWWIGASVAYFAMTAISPAQLSRAFTAKNEKSLLQGMAWGFPFVMIMLICVGVAMLMVNAEVSKLGPQIPKTDYAIGYLMKNMLPPWLGVVILSGLLAAGISTANVCLLVLAQGVGRDIYQKLINPTVTDKKLILVTRIVVGVATVILGLIAQLKFPWIIMVGTWAIGSTAPTLLPAALAGLFWRRTTEKAIYHSMLWGLVVYAVLIFIETQLMTTQAFLKAMVLPSILWAVILSGITLLVLTYTTKSTPVQQKTWDDLHAKMFPKERAHATTANWVWMLIPAVIFVVFIIWFMGKVIGT